MTPPGLTIGPLNVDAAGDLTARLGVHNKADRLLKRHNELYPAELRNALALPVDGPRTATLDIGEVEDALGSLRGRRAFFDPETDTLESATVRGNRESNRVVSVVFITKSGRSARGVLAYGGLSKSQRAFADSSIERTGAAAMVTPDSSPAWLEGGEPRPQVTGTGGSAPDDAPSSEEIRAAIERLEELQTANAEAEQRARVAEEERQALAEELERLKDPEPWDGYDEEGADTIAARVKEDGLLEFGKAGLERIATYESEHKNRSTVKNAVESALLAEQKTSTD